MQQTRIGVPTTRGRSRVRAAPLLGTALLATALASVVPVLTSAAPAAADRELFVRYGCYQCHGYEGQGGDGLRIAPSPYPFEAFVAKVRKPANEMPAYAPEVLSDADLQALYRYVRAIPEPTADIPLR
jgi:mono/diheme cytochrome c family protein